MFLGGPSLFQLESLLLAPFNLGPSSRLELLDPSVIFGLSGDDPIIVRVHFLTRFAHGGPLAEIPSHRDVE
jgi:hypothetical protein